MSPLADDAAGAAGTLDSGARAHEHPGGVVGLAVGLGVLALLALVLAGQRARPAAPDVLLERWLEPSELPFDLEPASAAVLSGGETALRLERAETEPEAPRKEPAKPQPGEPPRIDWARLPEGPRDRPPLEALLVRYPRGRAAVELPRLFRRPQHGPGGGGPGGGPPGGGPPGGELGPGQRVELERGQLAWGALGADFVRERELEPGGTFVETLRANLSVEGRYMALFLRWPRNLPASRARAEELLAALRPRSE